MKTKKAPVESRSGAFRDNHLKEIHLSPNTKYMDQNEENPSFDSKTEVLN